MRQDTTSALSGLASFAKLQELLAARSHAGSVEAMMTFETFEVELGKAVRGLENELKSADLARYDVEADAVIVDGKAWRTCLEQQPKTSLSRIVKIFELAFLLDVTPLSSPTLRLVFRPTITHTQHQ